MLRSLYWLFSHLGMMTVFAAFIMGFRHDPSAPLVNVGFNLLLYAAFLAVHIVMTMPIFKKTLFGRPEGTPFERRIYVTISVVTWVGLYALHWPVPGFAFDSPAWLRFVGFCGAVFSVVGFFEFATFESLGKLLGMPGTELSHSVGSESPLMTEGSYASVRHPMYRAAVFLGVSSLLIHPHAGQLLFAILTGISFVGFIPFEERQLVQARGEQYRAYMEQTPYRLFRRIW